jgi:hypothetical protein
MAGNFGGGSLPNSAGNATSRLVRVATGAQFEALTEAFGGQGSNQESSTSGASRGGWAVAEIDATNDAGHVTALGHALGGTGGDGYDGDVGGDGGGAQVRASATTLAGGHNVTVGGSGVFGAIGGLGRRGGPSSLKGEAGDGGHANSRSVGIALGDSVVSVHDRAIGGEGLSGGQSDSHAEGSNVGAENVNVLSEATGGRARWQGGNAGRANAVGFGRSTTGQVSVSSVATGGDMISISPFGTVGRAVADAQAVSGGDAIASATAHAGLLFGPSAPAVEGNAMARSTAKATGTTGGVQALATGSGGEIGTSAFRTMAVSNAIVGSAASAEARAGSSASGALSSTADAAAFVTGSHSRQGEWGRIGLNLNSTQASPDIVLRAEAGFENDAIANDPLEGVYVSFLATQIPDAVFVDVNFRIENAGENLIDEIFSSADEARVFFEAVIDLGELSAQLSAQFVDLRFILEMPETQEGSGFGIYLAVGTVVVPEPGTGVLMLIGLVLMAPRRQQTQR